MTSITTPSAVQRERRPIKSPAKLVILETLKEIVDQKHTVLVLWECRGGLVDRIHNREVFPAPLSPQLMRAVEHVSLRSIMRLIESIHVL